MVDANLIIAFGCDHGGYPLRKPILDALLSDGFEVIDVGTSSENSVDYPLYAERVGELVASGGANFGVLICKTGIGMSIAVNKIPGIRAALTCDSHLAKMSRQHNNANVICLGGGLDKDEAIEMVRVFVNTKFEGDTPTGERHARRISQIEQIERTHRPKKEDK